jgi:hypothetical protein
MGTSDRWYTTAMRRLLMIAALYEMFGDAAL